MIPIFKGIIEDLIPEFFYMILGAGIVAGGAGIYVGCKSFENHEEIISTSVFSSGFCNK